MLRNNRDLLPDSSGMQGTKCSDNYHIEENDFSKSKGGTRCKLAKEA